MELNRRVRLPSELRQLANQVVGAQTLPVAIDEVLGLLVPAAGQYPQMVRRSDVTEGVIKAPILAVIPTDQHVTAVCKSYISSASRILSSLTSHGFTPGTSTALEIGCGRGYMTHALSALGVSEAIGLDVKPKTYYSIAEEPLVQTALAHHRGGTRNKAWVGRGDALALPFPDESLDLVHSVSVLEHIPDPMEAFKEMYRVLKTGAFAYHGVDPWFSPVGGHSLCTLDFPWGHVRLSSEEFVDYVRQHRPYECEATLDFYDNGFQKPRLTVSEMEAIVIESGFEIQEWPDSKPAYQDHYTFLDQHLLKECRRNYPLVTVRDLMTSGYSMVLRKR